MHYSFVMPSRSRLQAPVNHGVTMIDRAIRVVGISITLILATLSSAALTDPAPTSGYTSLDKGCKILWRAADDDGFKSICPGRDGIRVILEGGDLRSWIGLLPRGVNYEKGVRFQEPMMSFGSFAHVVGTRLEWRYHGPKLVALIVRMAANRSDDSAANEIKELSGLLVLRVDTRKLDQTCAIGKTTSNDEALAIADDLSNTCYEKPKNRPAPR